MRLVSIVLLCMFFSFSACSEDAEKQQTAVNSNPELKPSSNLGEAATAQLVTLLNNYYTLKDALVATRAGEADNAANKLDKTADSLISYIRSDSTQQRDSLLTRLDSIKLEVKAMTGMMDEGCEKKRIHFEGISTAMYALLKQAELNNANIYRQYCPMAFNNKGAYWLSNTEEIRNPYFGDKMLECGEVTDTLN